MPTPDQQNAYLETLRQVEQIKTEKRRELNELISKLEPGQRDVINELFPEGVPDQNLHQMCAALQKAVEQNARFSECLQEMISISTL